MQHLEGHPIFKSVLFPRILWYVGLVFGLLGCTSNDHFPVSKLDAEDLPRERLSSSALSFRATMASVLEGRIKETDFRRLVLVPSEDIFAGQPASFDDVIKRFDKLTPEMLYKRSVGYDVDEGRVIKTEHIKPITLIVMPGLASEFSPESIFPEAVDDSSSQFAREVREKIAHAAEKDRLDEMYSLRELKDISVPLSDLIRTGSIDSPDRKAIVRVVYLVPQLGSLESLGSIYRLYGIYKRRLDKLFRVIGPQPNVYISGHSRGAASALDFVARSASDPTAAAWTQRIVGYIAFNGALFGSHYADAYFDPKQKPYQLHKVMVRLANLRGGMGPIDSFVDRNRILGSLLKLSDFMLNTDVLKNEYWDSEMPDLIQGIVLGRDLQEQLNPYSYFGEYERYIKRIKKLTEAAEIAISGLTHKARIKWWEQNTIPTNIPYYTLSSTMASTAPKKITSPWQKGLLESPFMGRNVVDYRIWRNLYYDYEHDGGVTLNDGLVGVHEGTFWPSVHMRLNPSQKPYKAESLGIFGAHHVAITYATLASSDPDDKNPFPRRALLQTIALYVGAHDKKIDPVRSQPLFTNRTKALRTVTRNP